MHLRVWPYGTTVESYDDDWNQCQITTRTGARCRHYIVHGQVHTLCDCCGGGVAKAEDVDRVERGICPLHLSLGRQP